VRDIVIKPHALQTYDRFDEEESDEHDRL
jgi:hypothetical protein